MTLITPELAAFESPCGPILHIHVLTKHTQTQAPLFVSATSGCWHKIQTQQKDQIIKKMPATISPRQK